MSAQLPSPCVIQINAGLALSEDDERTMNATHEVSKLATAMKKAAVLVSLAALLVACGGGGDNHPAIVAVYQGTLSGTNCFDAFAESRTVHYSVTITSLSLGGSVVLVDDSGATWSGTMTTPSSFEVSNAAADPRTSITASAVTPTGAHFVATTTCVSFRCCTALSGDLVA